MSLWVEGRAVTRTQVSACIGVLRRTQRRDTMTERYNQGPRRRRTLPFKLALTYAYAGTARPGAPVHAGHVLSSWGGGVRASSHFADERSSTNSPWWDTDLAALCHRAIDGDRPRAGGVTCLRAVVSRKCGQWPLWFRGVVVGASAGARASRGASTPHPARLHPGAAVPVAQCVHARLPGRLGQEFGDSCACRQEICGPHS